MSEMDLVLETETMGEWSILHVKGEVDVYSSPRLKESLVDLIEKQGRMHVVVDLGNVEFMDSSGLGVLVGGLRRVKEGGGEMALVCSKPVLRVLSITGLDKIFKVSSSVAEGAS